MTRKLIVVLFYRDNVSCMLNWAILKPRDVIFFLLFLAPYPRVNNNTDQIFAK